MMMMKKNREFKLPDSKIQIPWLLLLTKMMKYLMAGKMPKMMNSLSL